MHPKDLVVFRLVGNGHSRFQTFQEMTWSFSTSKTFTALALLLISRHSPCCRPHGTYPAVDFTVPTLLSPFQRSQDKSNFTVLTRLSISRRLPCCRRSPVAGRKVWKEAKSNFTALTLLWTSRYLPGCGLHGNYPAINFTALTLLSTVAKVWK